MLAALGHEAVGIQADTFARLVGGQIAETIGPRPGQDPLQHYLHVVKDKTASLVATAGRFGAMYSDAPADVVARIEPACEAIGVAWQLSDDILDVASDSDQSGKTPGTDLREGVRSLPVLYALASSRPADARLRELLTSADLTDPALHAEALEPAAGQPGHGGGPGGSAALGRGGAHRDHRPARRPGAHRVRGTVRLRGGPHRLAVLARGRDPPDPPTCPPPQARRLLEVPG